MAHLESQRLTLMGRHLEAFEVWIPESRSYMGNLVCTGREAIGHSADVNDKRSIARRIVTEMLSTGVFHDWTEIDETLPSLGLKSELRSILDAACSDPRSEQARVR